MLDDRADVDPPPASVYDVVANDPGFRLIDRTGVGADDLAQISELMQAMGALREVEARLAAKASAYMKLGSTDMRAVHFLIVCENRETLATAAMLAAHLGITSASTTKMVERLERGGHIVRSPHPTDGRAQVIRVTPETRTAATETVGRQQARRFYAAARLTPAEREVVIRFLQDTAEELSTPAARPE